MTLHNLNFPRLAHEYSGRIEKRDIYQQKRAMYVVARHAVLKEAVTLEAPVITSSFHC